jgi:hypothetical protein
MPEPVSSLISLLLANYQADFRPFSAAPAIKPLFRADSSNSTDLRKQESNRAITGAEWVEFRRGLNANQTRSVISQFGLALSSEVHQSGSTLDGCDARAWAAKVRAIAGLMDGHSGRSLSEKVHRSAHG